MVQIEQDELNSIKMIKHTFKVIFKCEHLSA